MTAYAFWNNKGGVGKSFLAFVCSCEYARKNPEVDVYVIDMCPQANLSETLLGGVERGSRNLNKLAKKSVRATVSGYLEARLNSPFCQIPEVAEFISVPYSLNSDVPRNLRLICGDNLLEIQAEAIRQTSSLAVPTDAWKQVISWVADLVNYG